VLARGLSVQAIRAKARAGTKCGPAENINIAVPLIESPEDINAAQLAIHETNAVFLTVMLEGKYTDPYLKQAGKDAPKFTDEDLKIISSPSDFVGINVYRPLLYVLASDKAPGWREIPLSKSHQKMHSRWHTIGPEALYWAPKFLPFDLERQGNPHHRERLCLPSSRVEFFMVRFPGKGFAAPKTPREALLNATCGRAQDKTRQDKTRQDKTVEERDEFRAVGQDDRIVKAALPAGGLNQAADASAAASARLDQSARIYLRSTPADRAMLGNRPRCVSARSASTAARM
jgi:hypothetical protein